MEGISLRSKHYSRIPTVETIWLSEFNKNSAVNVSPIKLQSEKVTNTKHSVIFVILLHSIFGIFKLLCSEFCQKSIWLQNS